MKKVASLSSGLSLVKNKTKPQPACAIIYSLKAAWADTGQVL